MRELHIHLHLDRKLLADLQGTIHVHLQAEGDVAAERAYHDYGPSGHKMQDSSGLVVARGDYLAPSGGVAPGSRRARQSPLRGEQRIRSKVYRLDFVPSEPCDEAKGAAEPSQPPGFPRSLMLELASGNQLDPITWESFEPHSQRGLWRFSVREDFGRLVGIVTYARDRSAVWVLPDWTPRGSLILDTADPQRYPRLMLTPVTAFQK